MSIYDAAEEMKDKAREASNKLDKAINLLSWLSKSDDTDDVHDAISEAVDILRDINGEIY